MSVGCRPFSDEEIDQFLKNANTMDRAMFCLGIRTGFRISELISITWGQVVDETGSGIRDSVEVPKRSVKGKTSSRRVPIHPQAKECLDVWARQAFRAGKEQRVFPISRVTAWRHLKNVVIKAGINQTKGRLATHTLRKSFARKMYEGLDHDLFRLQKAMAHSSIQITVKYLQLDAEEIDDVIRKVK